MKKDLSLLDRLDPKNILFAVNLINTGIASLYNYFQSKIGFVFLLILNVMFSWISCHFAEFDLSDKFVIFHKFLFYLYLTNASCATTMPRKIYYNVCTFPDDITISCNVWAFSNLTMP